MGGSEPQGFLCHPFSKRFLNIAIGLFLILTTFLHFTNFENRNTSWDKIFQNPFIKYFTSIEMSEKDVLKDYNPMFAEALKILNQNKASKIYQVGTFFSYHIMNGSLRILEDNNLNTFHQLTKKLEVQDDFFNILKNENYQYILYDLNTAGFDQTATQSLKKRATNFEKLLHVGRLRIVATDNIIQVQNPDTATSPSSVVGQYGWQGQTIRSGSFILFEIL